MLFANHADGGYGYSIGTRFGDGQSPLLSRGRRMKIGPDYRNSRYRDLGTVRDDRRRPRSESSTPAPGNYLPRRRRRLLQSASLQAPEVTAHAADRWNGRICLIHSDNDSVAAGG